jgi:hypothetical protein
MQCCRQSSAHEGNRARLDIPDWEWTLRVFSVEHRSWLHPAADDCLLWGGVIHCIRASGSPVGSRSCASRRIRLCSFCETQGKVRLSRRSVTQEKSAPASWERGSPLPLCRMRLPTDPWNGLGYHRHEAPEDWTHSTSFRHFLCAGGVPQSNGVVNAAGRWVSSAWWRLLTTLAQHRLHRTPGSYRS